ncbi:Mitochondrial transcription termination factor family protein [Forsythia ovata]|uniref:Mitochondrial transcription termination factor family protein n=1 Tax=Forsythia ovata TaxID=205694 RepID=A0ABD1PYJ3_9LAMI
MKIISHAGITKPSFLLVSYELPALTVRKPQLVSTSSLCISSYNEKRHSLMIRSHCSATGRTLSSSSTDLRLSKEDKFNRKREQVTSASLYTHPSLLQMKNERIANRTRVYELLRSIGVVMGWSFLSLLSLCKSMWTSFTNWGLQLKISTITLFSLAAV